MQTNAHQAEEETLGTRSEIEAVGACKRLIRAAVPVEKVREQLDRSYRELGEVVQLPGFRRGKVPRRLLEARFSEEVESDLKQSLVSASFAEVVEEQKLRMVGSPRFDKIELHPDADFHYEVEIEVRPDFDLVEYKGIEVARESVPFSEGEVDRELADLQRRLASTTVIGAEEAGPQDYYQGKYDLYRGDVKVKSQQKTIFQPASKVLDVFVVDDLAERVAAWDRSSGSPLRADVRVPSSYPDELLRGTEARLEFTLVQVTRPRLPDLGDEFAKTLGKETLDDLRGGVRESLLKRKTREEDRQVEEKIVERIVDATPMQLPEALIDSQRRRLELEREYALLEQGLSPDEVKKKVAAEGDRVSEELRRELKAVFILSEIADKEKIFVTEDEVGERIRALSGLYGVSPSKLRDELKSTGRLDDVRSSMRFEKTRAFLRKKAVVTESAGRKEAPEASEKKGDAPEKVEKTGETAVDKGTVVRPARAAAEMEVKDRPEIPEGT